MENTEHGILPQKQNTKLCSTAIPRESLEQHDPRSISKAQNQSFYAPNPELASPESTVVPSDETVPLPDSSTGLYTPQTTSDLTSSNIAALLASYRRSAEKAERRHPSVPRRTTSTTRPSKRKRHEDLVALHRNSCQLFSSLDGTLAQMRLPVSSSSFSSSSSSSPNSSPTIGSSTRNDSVDHSRSKSRHCPKRTNSSDMRVADVKLPVKRPTLQRMSCTIPSIEPHQNPESVSGYEQITRTSMSILDQPRSTVKPTTITTQSCYSSQLTLPLRSGSGNIPVNPTSTTTIQWTSPETRRIEYAKIDAANRGFRLFMRRMLPHSWCRKVGGGRAAFWNEHKDDETDDARSVRRFRVSTEDEKNCNNNSDSVKFDVASAEKHMMLDNTSELTGVQLNDKEKSSVNIHCRTMTGFSSMSGASDVPFLHSRSKSEMSACADAQETQRTRSWKKLLSCHL